MLDSLTDEVVEMARGNNATTTTTLDKNSGRNINMTIHLNNSTRLSSPLSSPMYIQNILSITKEVNTNVPRPPYSSSNSNSNINSNSNSNNIFDKSRGSYGQYDNDDDDDDNNDDNSTMCSIDNSIHNELNALKEVATELEKELEEENLNTVFEAIERIGNSDNQNVKNALDSEKKDLIRECIRDEIRKNKQKNFFILRYCRLGITSIIRTFEVNTKSIIILVVSIILGLVLKYISTSWAI